MKWREMNTVSLAENLLINAAAMNMDHEVVQGALSSYTTICRKYLTREEEE